MRNKNNFITIAKAKHGNEQSNNFVSIIIFEKLSNLKLKTNNFPFIKTLGGAVLDKQISVLDSAFPNNEIIFSCQNSFKVFEHIKKQHANIRIVENPNFTNSNCCESIKLAINNTFNNKLLIIPEDLLLSPVMLEQINLQENYIFVNDHNIDNNFDIGAINNVNYLENLTIGIKQNYWSEALFLGSEISVKAFREILSLESFKNKLFFESINHLGNKHKIQIKKISNIIKLNNAKTLKRINAE